MKHRFILAACIVAMTQSMAAPVDSLTLHGSKHPTTWGGDVTLPTIENQKLDIIPLRDFDPSSFPTLTDLAGDDTGGCETNGTGGGYSTDGMTGHPGSRTIKAEPSSLTFSNVKVGKKSTEKVKVYTLYITDYMTVTVQGTNKSMFSVDTSVLSHFETDKGMSGDKEGAELNITYRPTKAGTHKAQVLIKEHYWFFPRKFTITLTGKATGNSVTSIDDVEVDELDITGDVDAEWNDADDTEGVISLECDEVSDAPTLAAPAVSTDLNELTASVKIFTDGRSIVVDSPVEQYAIVSDIAGRSQRVVLTTGRNVIPVGTHGVFVVRVGEQTAKLMLR